MTAGDPGGLLVVDKPAGMTSHDVVARIRRLAGTRRVGHAGTLDPMATGVLVIGIGQATRLLGHLAGHDKEYAATVRLGATTSTDDAEGTTVTSADPAAVAAVTDADLGAAMAGLTGAIQQVPPAVSAVKVGGVRSYTRARAGEQVVLQPRPVTVARFDLVARRGADVDVEVACSAGTYIRSLARDLGAALGVGAHLTALRRVRSGQFGADRAIPLDALDPARDAVPLAQAAAGCFPTVPVDAEEAQRMGHGQRRVVPGAPDAGTVAVVDPQGRLVALAEIREGVAHPLAVFGDR